MEKLGISETNGLVETRFVEYLERLSNDFSSYYSECFRFDFTEEESSILFFEHLEVENLHLVNDKFGLYLNDDEIFVGKFIQHDNQLILELNQWKQIIFDVENIKHFYQFYAVYKKV